jgi:hypothetical protein
MSKEIKLKFDTDLAKMLSDLAQMIVEVKATKKALKITSETIPGNLGEIEFDYLGDQKAYYFGVFAWSEDFSRFIEKPSPPYESNIPEGFEYQFSMNTLMEDRGVYSRSNGKLLLPDNTQGIEENIAHIRKCIGDFYIPWVQRFVSISPNLIDDIIKNPRFYSYPAPLIAYAMKHNSMRVEDINIMPGKSIIKNKEFDEKLLSLA